MEKYSEIIGKSVICAGTGKKLGAVKEVAFSPKSKEVKALILERKGYELSKKAVLLRDILSFGRDVVVVNDNSVIKSLRKVEQSGELKDKGQVKGLRVYTKSGEDLGVVEDVLFDHDSGLIEGVEVSDGLLQDIASGRNILPLFGKVEFSEESIVVEKEAVDEIMSTGGGLIKFFNKERK